MTIRTSQTTLTFRSPFLLGGFEELLPAGSYEVETDEALLEGPSFPAYRRLHAVIHLPSESGDPGLTRALQVDPHALDAALARDRAPEESLAAKGVNAGKLQRPVEVRRDEADRHAVERGENEGMRVHPG